MEQEENKTNIIGLERARKKRSQEEALENLKNGSLKEVVGLLKNRQILIGDLEKKKALSAQEVYLLEEIGRLCGIIEDLKLENAGYKRTNELLNRDLTAQKTENRRLSDEIGIFRATRK